MASGGKLKRLPRAVVSGIVSPFERFSKLEASSGLVLLAVTVFTLLWANSPWALFYELILEAPISLQVGPWSISESLHHWVNDGLMTIFFFLVGLEIKRELALGELSSVEKARLPMIAAVGGMVIPALIYATFNVGTSGSGGWGIPMATDIAFAIGVLSLMHHKVPLALRVFLLALAIVDDLGAVLVIALFYTKEVVAQNLGLAALGVFVTVFFKYAGVRRFSVYWILGIWVWFFVFRSGIHATVAGVILGLLTPTQPFEGLRSPLDLLIDQLHSLVSFGIMPLFAFANAGVHFSGEMSWDGIFSHSVALGIALGLVVGKPLGILLFSWIAVSLGWAGLPAGVQWRHMTAVAMLGGIGFTMALFIGQLALQNQELESIAKISILVSSVVAGVLGMGLLALLPDLRVSGRSSGK